MRVLAACTVFLVCCLPIRGQDEEGSWSRKNYPNPLVDFIPCATGGQKAYVCDPSNILKAEEARQLNAALWSIRNETGCPCADHFCTGSDQGYKVGVALVKKIKPDVSARTEENENDVSFQIDQSLHESRLFTYTLLQRWQMGTCSEDVLIMYSLVDNVFYTMTGEVAAKKLTPSIIGEIAMNTRQLMRPSTSFEGLYDLVKQYKAVFMGTYKGQDYALKMPDPAAQTSGVSSVLPGLLGVVAALMATLRLL